ncbi:MAG: hypothetical protein M0R40_09050 [Firmicutes bacterium]|nr:hypothetical protein [Bacillota bacterium]
MEFSKHDTTILRQLASEKAEIAALPINDNNKKLWYDTNDLKATKPPIFINELPWHEMNINDELTLRCKNSFARELELLLRKELYCYRHVRGNMVVTDSIDCPVVIKDSGFGIDEDVDIRQTDANSNIVSRTFNVQISGIEDIEKIKDPVITLDKKQSKDRLDLYREVFDGLLRVQQVGVKGYWFTPWDNLVRWTGVQEALMDLIINPEYIEKLVERFVDASISRLEQYENLGLWASNNNNTRVGSGGYGYTTALADADEHLINTALTEVWGCGNAQIFSDVSSQMHWDFSLKHELRWLERFGLNYYGCCEPLHLKMDILDKVPNLRKVSASPWAKLEKMRDHAKGKYVLSCKPNPAIFADANWSIERAEADILNILEKSGGCNIEIIMKDVSTVSYKPERLWQWSKIAQNTVDKFYK